MASQPAPIRSSDAAGFTPFVTRLAKLAPFNAALLSVALTALIALAIFHELGWVTPLVALAYVIWGLATSLHVGLYVAVREAT